MTSTPISYDVLKVSELELIGRTLNGNDELLVNDLLVAPVESKRCRVIDLADSIRPLVLPIASETVLGGIKVGEGLAIDKSTGVLSTNIVNNFDDLEDVQFVNLQENQLVIYNGTNWVNVDSENVFVEIIGGDAIDVRDEDNDQKSINVRVSNQGIGFDRDNNLTTKIGFGLKYDSGNISVNPGSGIFVENNDVSVKVTRPIYFTPSNSVGLNYGYGLRLNNSNQSLEIDPNVVALVSESVGNLTITENLTVRGSTSLRSTDIAGNLRVTGNVTATDFISTSDANLKDNIETIEGALDKVNGIRGVTFDWKRDGKPGMGVIAQELEEILPKLVVGETQKAVNYNGLIGLLIEAVKELSKEVEELKNK